MQTYTAMLARWAREKICGAYIERARADARERMDPSIRTRHAYETMCAYCGEEGCLEGIIGIGDKDRARGIPMDSDGYRHHLPEENDRDTEILLIRCVSCGAALPGTAYLSPAVFARNHSAVILLPNEETPAA